MSQLKIPFANITMACETGKVSDGYHTFDELYEHRCLLFLALMKSAPHVSWYSRIQGDGSVMCPGWFVAGMDLPFGQVTYHLPEIEWPLAKATGAKKLKLAPKWDGHTSADVLTRLRLWI